MAQHALLHHTMSSHPLTSGGAGGWSCFPCFSPPSHPNLSFHHGCKYCSCFPGLPSLTWLHTHSPQPQEAELQQAHYPQEENLSDVDPMFACRVTFNPSEYGGSPYKTPVQPAVWQGKSEGKDAELREVAFTAHYNGSLCCWTTAAASLCKYA